MNNLRENIQLLWDFYVVAKEGNMTQAASKIYTSPSNLSKRMQTLENNLNLKLIKTNNKGLTLTTDGKQLFKELESKTLSNLILKNNKETFKTKIVIGTTRNIADNVLAKYLYEYMTIYPNVEIKIITDSASNLNNYLLDHQIDILIDYLPQINFTEKHGFTVKYFSEFKTCFACNKEFFEKTGKYITSLEELNNYNLIIPGSSRRRQILDEVLQKNNITLKPRTEMPDSKLMADIIKHGNFIGYFILEEVAYYDLVKLNLKEEMPTNPYGIMYSKETINPKAMNFIELLVNKE